MNPATIRVRAPESVVFLCGGIIPTTTAVVTLRHAFSQILAATPPTYKVILAETADPLTTDAGYRDLLDFEADIAGAVGIILLFAESAGSLAELGAFSALEEVAPSLLVVTDDYYYNEKSFIRRGPLKHLEATFSDEWIVVLERADVGIHLDTGSPAALDLLKFDAALRPAIERRLKARPDSELIRSKNNSHIILLIVGLCQEFGALTQTEIRDFVKALTGVQLTPTRLQNFIFCGKLLGWIAEVRKGHNIFFVAELLPNSAIEYNFMSASSARDKARVRTEIRAYWKAAEPHRWRAISAAAAKAASSTP